MAEDARERRIPKEAHHRSTIRLRSAYHHHIILAPSPCQETSSDSDSDDSDDELLLMLLLDDDDEEVMAGMYAYALHAEKHLSRTKYRQPALTGFEWVQNKLADTRSCYNMFRMNPSTFHRLHALLVQSYGLHSSSKSTSLEALAMFLWIVGGSQPYRQADDRFERSLATVHNLFHKVLKCAMRLVPDIMKPVDPQFSAVHDRLKTRRFYPEFKDCIGAIDGTHVRCIVPHGVFVQHLCLKGVTTQNVMAACDFDMRFTFVLAGWPGSVHDMRVFDDALTRWSNVFPHPPAGKYYLVDSGYPNRTGYIAPYRGSRYHLQEYQDAPAPEGAHEVFNYAHSSLRNVIERSFGVLKMKWRILKEISRFAPRTQAQIIYACCALHNFVRESGLRDRHFRRCDRDPRRVHQAATEDQSAVEEPSSSEDSLDANALHDSITNSLVSRR